MDKIGGVENERRLDGKDMNVRKVRDWAVREAIQPQIERLSVPINGFGGDSKLAAFARPCHL